MKEIFKDIVGYEGLYQISNYGNVKSLRKNIIMKPSINGKGYYIIKIYKDGIRKTFSVHRLTAVAFLDNPDCLSDVNHKDENKLNNRIDNLEWCSCLYNQNYGTRNKRISDFHKGRISNRAKQIFCDNRVFASIKECSKYYSIPYEKMIYWLSGKYEMPKQYQDMNLRYI